MSRNKWENMSTEEITKELETYVQIIKFIGGKSEMEYDRDTWQVKRIQRINQKILPDSHLVCYFCNNFLESGKVWAFTRNENMCLECKDKMQTKKPVFAFLKPNFKVGYSLRDFLYPCNAQSECNFIGSYQDAKKHSEKCVPTFNCSFCSGIVDKHFTIAHFLEQHCDNKLFASHTAVFEKVMLKLPLLKHKIHILRSGSTNYVLIFIPRNTQKISLYILKDPGFKGEKFNRFTNDKYVVEWVNTKNNTKRKGHGTTVSVEKYFSNPHKIKYIPIIVEHKQSTKLQFKIEFNNFPKTIPEDISEECPICFNNIELTTKKCKNGHSVCNNCEKMITVCPFCRELMNLEIELKNMLPKRFVKCINKHCLQVMYESELKQHLKSECAFEMLRCPHVDCKTVTMPRIDLLKHLTIAYGKNLHNYEFYFGIEDEFRYEYIFVYDKLFRLKIRYNNTQKDPFFTCKVTLMHEKRGEENKFSYDLWFFEKPSDVKAKAHRSAKVNPWKGSEWTFPLMAHQIPRVSGDDDSIGFFRIYIKSE